MKLYQYTFVRYGTGINFEELDVEEKPKTYTIFNAWRQRLNKEDVGKVSGYGHNVVILPEKDFEKAKGLYLEYLRKGIIEAEKHLESIKNTIRMFLIYQNISNMEVVQ